MSDILSSKVVIVTGASSGLVVLLRLQRVAT